MIFNTEIKENERRLAIELCNIILKEREKLVFVCVGTDRVVGDCLSPIISQKVKALNLKNAIFYGDLDKPITYANLRDNLNEIKKAHPYSKLIIVDSVLGEADEVGCVKLEKNGVLIGGEYHSGVYAGDYHLLGVVNARGINSLTFLKSVRLKNVVCMANFIYNSINLAYKYCIV